MIVRLAEVHVKDLQAVCRRGVEEALDGDHVAPRHICMNNVLGVVGVANVDIHRARRVINSWQQVWKSLLLQLLDNGVAAEGVPASRS